jgi:hypothetical protein
MRNPAYRSIRQCPPVKALLAAGVRPARNGVDMADMLAAVVLNEP